MDVTWDSCYTITGSITFLCPNCSTKAVYDFEWRSIDPMYKPLECSNCGMKFSINMLKIRDWEADIYILDVNWDYVISKPENEDAVKGSVVWIIR